MAVTSVDRLIILGNGFDLAHDLKTSYGDFIKDIIERSINYDTEVREHLLDVGTLLSEYQTYSFIKEHFVELANHRSQLAQKSGKITVHNRLLYSLLCEYFQANWVDIEQHYFTELCESAANPLVLNREFEVIKTYLKSYLDIQFNDDVKPIPDLLDAFVRKNQGKVLFLNFNYTPTIELYLSSMKGVDADVIYIHGKLGKEDNPIVFGYGDDTNPKYLDLVAANDNSFLRNLKRQQYNLANSYKKLSDFLDSARDIEVYSVGHSLGISDKTLLMEVFDHPKVYSVKLFYYKDSEGYRGLNDNISRIVSSKTLNRKVMNFTECESIPQHTSPFSDHA